MCLYFIPSSQYRNGFLYDTLELRLLKALIELLRFLIYEFGCSPHTFSQKKGQLLELCELIDGMKTRAMDETRRKA